MGHREKLKSGDEVDAILARHVYCYLKNRPRLVKLIKRALNKRIRRQSKPQVLDE